MKHIFIVAIIGIMFFSSAGCAGVGSEKEGADTLPATQPQGTLSPGDGKENEAVYTPGQLERWMMAAVNRLNSVEEVNVTVAGGWGSTTYKFNEKYLQFMPGEDYESLRKKSERGAFMIGIEKEFMLERAERELGALEIPRDAVVIKITGSVILD